MWGATDRNGFNNGFMHLMYGEGIIHVTHRRC